MQSTMFSSRSRIDAQKYIEQERTTAQAAQSAKVKIERAAEDRRLARYWGLPIAELRANLKQPALDKFSGLTQVEDRQAPTDGEACNSALLACVDQLKAEGVSLSEDGILRLTCYGVAHSGVFADMAHVENWRRAFNRLTELKSFAPGEVEIVAVPKPAAAPMPAVTDIEQLDTSTREGQRAAKKIVFEQAMISARPLFSQFVEHMRKTWNLAMDQDQQDAVCLYLYRNNLGITAKSLDKARQVVLECRTQDELLALNIEQHDGSVADYAVRKDISNRIRQIQN